MNRKTILIVAVVAYIAYVYLKPGQHTAQATVMSVLDGFGISGGGMSTKVAVAVMFLLFVFRDSEHMPDIIKSYLPFSKNNAPPISAPMPTSPKPSMPPPSNQMSPPSPSSMPSPMQQPPPQAPQQAAAPPPPPSSPTPPPDVDSGTSALTSQFSQPIN
jgi:hypothetical protein